MKQFIFLLILSVLVVMAADFFGKKEAEPWDGETKTIQIPGENIEIVVPVVEKGKDKG